MIPQYHRTDVLSLSLPDCSLNEDNYSLRCPKHKVRKEGGGLIPFIEDSAKNLKYDFNVSHVTKSVVGF